MARQLNTTVRVADPLGRSHVFQAGATEKDLGDLAERVTNPAVWTDETDAEAAPAPATLTEALADDEQLGAWLADNTVADVTDALHGEIDADPEVHTRIAAVEKAGQNRKGVIAALQQG